MANAFITGVSGTALTADERAFLRDADPWGFILFKRNVDTPEQVRALVDAMREAVGQGDAPVLIDQEGGRVQRLAPPHWPKYPPGAHYAALYEKDKETGLVAAIAQAVTDGLMDAGVLPVLKHIPGHGRATADSHLALPVVDIDQATLESSDFAAFKPLAQLPLGMTAHVVFSAIDPDAPATTSVKMVREVIRGFIGFDGLLMSDDVSMNALSGTLARRTRAALAAGCDVALHCNGKLDEMYEVASESPKLAGEPARRANAALAARRKPMTFDVAEARLDFDAMLARV